MAITIIVGDNSYVSLAEANTYFETRIKSEIWTTSNNDDKSKALITATKKIDYEDFYGSRETSTQLLKFPRIRLDPIDGVDINSIIPLQIKEATYELAIYMLSVDMSQKTVTSQTAKKEKVGVLETEYFGNNNGDFNQYSDEMPPFANDLLRDLTKGGSSDSSWFFV